MCGGRLSWRHISSVCLGSTPDEVAPFAVSDFRNRLDFYHRNVLNLRHMNSCFALESFAYVDWIINSDSI